MAKKEKDGFIVHPFETGSGQFHASYANGKATYNNTTRNFRTLRDAKNYLRKNKVRKALYDSPSGPREIEIKEMARKRATKRSKRVNRTVPMKRATKRSKRVNRTVPRKKSRLGSDLDIPSLIR